MMKKRVILFLTCLLLICSFLIPVSAARNPVVDNASLFSISELTALQEKAMEVSGEYQMEVVILTVNSLDGKTPQNYADDYYDEHGYGYGDNKSGVLFLIAMDSRDWYVSTCGDAIYALTDYGIEQIFSGMSSYLSSGNYYKAFEIYLDSLPAYFQAYENGAPIDGYTGSYDGPGSYSPGTAEETVHYQGKPNHVKIILISVGIGAAIALIVVLIMRSSMNTAKQQHNAGNYLINGSFNLGLQRDIYLYSNVTRTRRESSSSSGGGGGSSVHRSSGGVRHGGGGGKF